MTKVVSSNSASSYVLSIRPADDIGPLMAIESIMIPDTYYNIYANVDITFTGVFANGLINIQAGQYEIDDLLNAMITQMNAIDAPSVYTFSAVPLTLSWVIDNAAPGTFVLDFSGLMLSYFNPQYVSASDTINLGVLDLVRTRAFWIYCSQFDEITYYASGAGNQTPVRIPRLIGVIPVSSQDQYIGAYFNHNTTGIVNNSWLIEIKDDSEVPIEFNGHEWIVVFHFAEGNECGCYGVSGNY